MHELVQQSTHVEVPGDHREKGKAEKARSGGGGLLNDRKSRDAMKKGRLGRAIKRWSGVSSRARSIGRQTRAPVRLCA